MVFSESPYKAMFVCGQVACMQFVNIIVHSVEDMNYRVHLQYEFTKLGLDDYLEKLRHTESEDLQVHNCLNSSVCTVERDETRKQILISS